MAKRRKKSKKRERIPVIDTLIDLAAAATLDYIAYKRRQKRGGKRSNKIDPYEATGFAMGMGLIDDTEDLIKFGGMLGAMGAFDPDDELYIDTESYSTPRDNRYAWRLNCEDGSKYGIDPDDYETREEYNTALKHEKYSWRSWCEDGSKYGLDPKDFETEDEYKEAFDEARRAGGDAEDEYIFVDDTENEQFEYDTPVAAVETKEEAHSQEPDHIRIAPSTHDPYENDDFHVYVYCRIELAETKEQRYYRTEDRSLKKGEKVIVPDPSFGEPLVGVILSVEHHMRFSVPQPINETHEIIKRA